MAYTKTTRRLTRKEPAPDNNALDEMKYSPEPIQQALYLWVTNDWEHFYLDPQTADPRINGFVEYAAAQLLRSLSAEQLESKTVELSAFIATGSPADLWINGKSIEQAFDEAEDIFNG